MMNWNIWQGEAAAWDEPLMRFPDYTVYQCHAWGEHRARFGWTPHRLIATDAGRTAAMAQVLVRRFPMGVALAWVAGGPVGDIETWGKPFQQALKKKLGARFLYCRVNPMRERCDSDTGHMAVAGWHRPSSPLLSGLSAIYLPAELEAAREDLASKNWRHNLRRAFKQGNAVRLWPSPDPDEMMTAYQAMQSHKKLGEQTSRAALVSLFENFGGNCVVTRCDDAQGRLLALRGALILGHRAWDIFAAATPEARKVYASHAAFWELMKQCAARGVKWYDMSGVDPVGNKGVYDFKKGTGASETAYLGEWDWASAPFLRRLANVMIKRRAGGM